VLLGLSAKGAFTPEMIASMAPNPVIFAMANPDPEITPEEVHAVRKDAIMGTGRSDYPNQVNNVLGFPYIFRGALDVRARRVNHEMKIACANALAMLAREDVPDEVAAAYHGRQLKFGPQYIIPSAFDPRLIWYVPPFVAQAAMDTGVARKPIADMDAYRASLAQRLDPTAGFLQKISGAVLANPKRIVFAEGEDPSVIRAAYAFQTGGFGKAILCGRENLVHENMKLVGLDPETVGLEIVNARLSDRNPTMSTPLHAPAAPGLPEARRPAPDQPGPQQLRRLDGHPGRGRRHGHRRHPQLRPGPGRGAARRRPGPRRPDHGHVGGAGQGPHDLRGRHQRHRAARGRRAGRDRLEAARAVKRLGFKPRVAFMSYSTFGNPMGERSEKVREAVAMLDEMDVDFEYEGEMPPELALDPEKRANYPFMRLTDSANILVMPAIHSASIATKLVQSLGGATVIGPVLLGLSKSVQIAPLSASVSKILNMAMMAAYDAPVDALEE
jgi:malate dehydrogenase (oxaloacetate-decarboxylating)(NADP+)